MCPCNTYIDITPQLDIYDKSDTCAFYESVNVANIIEYSPTINYDLDLA
jgi:hypothetical protein